MSSDITAVMDRLRICPVRHHSPAAAMAVERAVLETRPRLVLVEGPSDATSLIPLLLEPDTRPPVAILAYRPATAEHDPRTLAVPFCDYSPELVALRSAARLGAEARFCDAPAGFWLDREGADTEERAGETLPDIVPLDLFQTLAEPFGFTTHDEFWDSRVEMAQPEAVPELVVSYGDMVRDRFGEIGDRPETNPTRESWMLRELARALEEGYQLEEIVVVCGAAHAAGLRGGTLRPELVAALERVAPAAFTLIPYSFPRLSEQSGYGAGNRAPAFYQEVWRRRGDWNGASLDFLLRLMSSLRSRGYVLSLADAIEAQRLASNLAGLRDKPAVGLEEVADAAVACYGRDGYDPRHHLLELLIGEEVGATPSRVAKTALQQEFLDQIKRYGIPFADSPRELRLNLASQSDRAPSTFLHRLGVAGVPFARLVRSGASLVRQQRDADGDPLERLMALRERWEVRWTPATDVRLIELAVYGNRLAEVCGRLLRKRLEAARNLAEAAAVLLDVVVGQVGDLYDEVLAACERASAEDEEFSSLGRAAYLLDTMLEYGRTSAGAGLLPKLAERVFARACLLLPAAADAAEDEAGKVADAVKLLHQVAAHRRGRGNDDSLFVERLTRTADADSPAYPSIAGMACALLYLDGHLSDEGLAAALGLRLSRGEEPLDAARFVEGLFSLNRAVLVRNRALVGNLTDFLVELEREPFLAVLPVLRRSLAGLSPSEMGYLAETIAAALGITQEGVGDVQVDAGQLEELQALDQELGDLFG